MEVKIRTLAPLVHVGHICMGLTNIPVFLVFFVPHNLMPEDSCGISTLQDTVQ